MAAPDPLRIAIVGGGVSGLAAAESLLRQAQAIGRRLDLRVFEAADRPGGKVSSRLEDGWLTEGGPDAFLLAKPAALQLCLDLGLADRLIPTQPAARQVYVLSGGRLRPLPLGLRLTAPTAWGPFLRSDLLSWPGKLRMALDLVLPARAWPEGYDESIGSFVRRRLGREALAKLADPIMAGIYMGDPDQLSLRDTFPQLAQLEARHGSLIRGLRQGARAAAGRSGGSAGSATGTAALAGSIFFSLKGGTGELVAALARAVGTERLHLGKDLRSLESAADPAAPVSAPASPYRLRFADGAAWEADRVVLAAPAAVSAALLRPLAPTAAGLIAAIPHSSSAILNLGYDAAAFGHDLRGSGYVVAAGEPHPLRACSWSSTKLAGRAPEGKVLLRAFFGGVGREADALLPQEELLTRAEAAWTAHLGLRGKPELVRVDRWVGANPQVPVGHAARVAGITAGLPSGLHLLGAAFHGVGVPDCVKAAQAMATVLLAGDNS